MINIRTHNEFVLQAGLHGHKMELKKVIRQVQELSDETLKMIEDVHRQAIKRKFEERNSKS